VGSLVDDWQRSAAAESTRIRGLLAKGLLDVCRTSRVVASRTTLSAARETKFTIAAVAAIVILNTILVVITFTSLP
jgi:hypothetical protein